MSRPFEGVINIDIRDSVPDWAPYMQPVAPQGAPNVLYIVLDDQPEEEKNLEWWVGHQGRRLRPGRPQDHRMPGHRRPRPQLLNH